MGTGKRRFISVFLGLVLLVAGSGCGSGLLAIEAYDEPVQPYRSDGRTVALTNQKEINLVPTASHIIVINGVVLDPGVSLLLADGTLLAPVEKLAEALDVTLDYEIGTETVTAVKDDTEVKMQIGSLEAWKNGFVQSLPAAPVGFESVMMVPVRYFSNAFEAVVRWDAATQTVAVDYESNLLPAIGSREKLKELLENDLSQGYYGVAFTDSIAVRGSAVMSDSQSAVTVQESAAANRASAFDDSYRIEAESAGGGAGNYSTTNVQVAGVDEADVVKTDGQYIYQVNGQRIVIARAYPAAELSLVSTISLADTNLSPQELYVDGDRLIVIGSSYKTYVYPMPVPFSEDSMPEASPWDEPAAGAGVTSAPERSAAGAGSASTSEPSAAIVREIAPININITPTVEVEFTEKIRELTPLLEMYPVVHNNIVKTLVYDISDRSNPQLLKEVEVEGNYISSRKVDNQVYVLSNRYLNRYQVMNEGEAVTPFYRDSAVGEELIYTSLEDIRYFPDTSLTSYTLVAGINVEDADEASDISVYLGGAESVYASTDNLYITLQQYKITAAIHIDEDQKDSVNRQVAVIEDNEVTVIYKLQLDDGKVRYAAQGEVPGRILNQFSMDEHNGHFRIATTKGQMWRTDEHTSRSNVYILDENMTITGKVEDIAPGETIYSVRFMGNKGYMVTFRQVDPLFVLDLADPYNPSILGQLKIPGYSDYLHPYDENHLIGFGKDAVEMKDGDGTAGLYQGMKLAIFDVTDVANPVELFQTIIGDRGTESELLHNHKALLFSREKNLLAFPITVAELDEASKNSSDRAWAHGQFAFQGAYIYHVDLDEGFRLRGTITHLSDEEQLKMGDWYYGGSQHHLERILYIGDTLYTLSKGQIRANDLDSLSEQSRLQIP